MADAARKRLAKEVKQLKKKPLDLIWTEPDPANIQEWHYCFEGPKDTPYEGGFYHGVLKFPNEYPFKPPAIYMYTPNGRYKQNTRICTSFSDFHPESWQSTQTISTVLVGLLSFMTEECPNAIGGMQESKSERKKMARESGAFNKRNEKFCKLFPYLLERM
ncbi:Oidioi.mRNA.OKI2018_I69.chr2.g6879.t1.cds [Oikopleura dioica]|uniref:Oidioi.mRNA.OKI2018_I69.chr2.g6879.t1.cds n=1 Tax=Oikopleura dioica TaxID=34765 RepID=A0ABN7T528_OIKDI|nr:Oidioi.mRNA.OKI2018_I69.chr2.g6879.t1.cds [Oikopleura dioica]